MNTELVPAVVFVFIDQNANQVLMEKRMENSSYAGELIFPGGKLEPIDNYDLRRTLLREVREELGVMPIDFRYLPSSEIILSENGRPLHLFAVTSWEGNIPQHSLDKNNPLSWEPIETSLTSPIGGTRKLARLLEEYFIH